MVNPNLFTLYNRLKNSPIPLPGGKIGEEMGVSKVAVWKMMGKLEDLGVHIERSPKGYRLQERDPLHGLSYPQWQENIHFSQLTDSTMTLARELAHKECWGHVVVAERQTDGRSREGQTWDSPSGGLYLTAVFCPNSGSLLDQVPLGLRFLLEFAQEAEKCWGLALRVRWPGDLLYQGQKVGGILIEAAGDSAGWQYCNIGLGLQLPLMGEYLPKTNNPEVPGRHEILELVLELIQSPQPWEERSVEYPQMAYSPMDQFRFGSEIYRTLGLTSLGSVLAEKIGAKQVSSSSEVRAFHPKEKKNMHFFRH